MRATISKLLAPIVILAVILTTLDLLSIPQFVIVALAASGGWIIGRITSRDDR